VHNNQQQMSASYAEEMAKPILAEGWRLTREILALKGTEIPHMIEFLIDGARQCQATRVATLEELALGIAALDHAIEHPSEHRACAMSPYLRLESKQLHKERDALVELQKRANQGGAPASTTVIEALFPDVPVKKRTAAEKAEIEQRLAIRKEEALKIDPETAEVYWQSSRSGYPNRDDFGTRAPRQRP
jgi:hypothetical protein